MKIIRKPSSKDRRDHIFAAGKAKGLEEGTKIGRALGLEEVQRERNLVASQAVELATLKLINDDQERELAVLRSFQASFLGLSSSASATRPASSVYFKR